MRKERGTFNAKTPTETKPSIPQFSLGPFVVQCTPNAYEHYTRYAIQANEVTVREQISYPEEADGWYGMAFCKANQLLTEEQLSMLAEFRTQLARRFK